jgi:hypothetical protein
MARKQTRIGHVGKASPLHCGTGKEEGPACLAADTCLRRKRYAHLHSVPYRVPDNRVRTMHTPGKAISLGSSEDLVLLRIVEVINFKPALLFAEGGGRQPALAVALEGPKVVLQGVTSRKGLLRTLRRS